MMDWAAVRDRDHRTPPGIVQTGLHDPSRPLPALDRYNVFLTNSAGDFTTTVRRRVLAAPRIDPIRRHPARQARREVSESHRRSLSDRGSGTGPARKRSA